MKTHLALPKDIENYVKNNTPNAEGVWNYFNDIRQIPRLSTKEAAMMQYIIEFAEKNSFDYDADATGNLVVRVPSNNGSNNTVCLQSHMDMVADVAKGSTFDFYKDTIELVLDNGWITAKNTSLGADNGMGIANALNIATDNSVKHPNLEILCTVNEETGCNGADALGLKLESKYLINIDSEDGPVIYNGCAGSITLNGKLSAKPEIKSDGCYKLTVSGLKGGHSGIEIHEDRGNAFSIVGKLLERIVAEYKDRFHIIAVNGEEKQARNKIPKYAEVSFMLPPFETVNSLSHKYIKHIIKRMSDADILSLRYAGIDIQLNATDHGEYLAFSNKVSKDIVGLMNSDHSGVYSWAITGEVPHTSSNLGVMKTTENGIEITDMIRSTLPQELEIRYDELQRLFLEYGFEPKIEGRMDPWNPVESHLLDTAKEVGNSVYSEGIKVKVVHAGLECGIIQLKFPGMEAISIGPEMLHVHTFNERVNIDSVGKTYDLLKKIVERF
ncbi:MAG: beta-Ala-His dipeptidase [Candidatus Woesearchaeota archaeon]